MYIRQLDILFHQITMFIKVHVPFVFGLQLKDLVNSSNQRVWSSKTKATRTYMNVWIWRKSISKQHIIPNILLLFPSFSFMTGWKKSWLGHFVFHFSGNWQVLWYACSMHVLYDFCIFIFQVRSKYKGTIYTNFDQILVVFFNSVALLVILMRHECTNSAKYYIA